MCNLTNHLILGGGVTKGTRMHENKENIIVVYTKFTEKDSPEFHSRDMIRGGFRMFTAERQNKNNS